MTHKTLLIVLFCCFLIALVSLFVQAAPIPTSNLHPITCSTSEGVLTTDYNQVYFWSRRAGCRCLYDYNGRTLIDVTPVSDSLCEAK